MERLSSPSANSTVTVIGREAAEGFLRAGKWAQARAAYEADLQSGPSPDTLRGLGESLWWLGDIEASNANYRRAYAAYLRRGDSLLAAQTALALCVTYKFCLGNDPVATGWLGRAERAVSGDELAIMRGYFWLLRAYLRSAYDLKGALELTQLALAEARTSGDKDLELCALGDVGIALVMSGRLEEGMQFVDEAMAGISGREYSRPETVVFVSCTMLNACEAARDWDRATKWRPLADDFVDAFGCPYLYTECRSIHASILFATGEWQEAERELQLTARMTASVYPSMYAETIAHLAELRIRQGRIDEAEALLREVEERPQALPAVAALQLARGRYSVAKALLQRCLRHLNNETLMPVRVLEMLVEVQLALGDQRAARASLDRLRSNVCCKTALEAAARAEMAAGRFEAFLGDSAGAAAHFEATAAAFLRLRMPYEAASARVALAEALRNDNPELAAAEAQGAMAAFEKLGAKDQADRTSALLRTLGVAAKPGPRGFGVLSQREMEVLQLIGAGLSNPEIASRLYISRKTAAHHVSAILEKLALRNRAEAAGYATRLAAASSHGSRSS